MSKDKEYRDIQELKQIYLMSCIEALCSARRRLIMYEVLKALGVSADEFEAIAESAKCLPKEENNG